MPFWEDRNCKPFLACFSDINTVEEHCTNPQKNGQKCMTPPNTENDLGSKFLNLVEFLVFPFKANFEHLLFVLFLLSYTGIFWGYSCLLLTQIQKSLKKWKINKKHICIYFYSQRADKKILFQEFEINQKFIPLSKLRASSLLLQSWPSVEWFPSYDQFHHSLNTLQDSSSDQVDWHLLNRGKKNMQFPSLTPEVEDSHQEDETRNTQTVNSLVSFPSQLAMTRLAATGPKSFSSLWCHKTVCRACHVPIITIIIAKGTVKSLVNTSKSFIIKASSLEQLLDVPSSELPSNNLWRVQMTTDMVARDLVWDFWTEVLNTMVWPISRESVYLNTS